MQKLHITTVGLLSLILSACGGGSTSTTTASATPAPAPAPAPKTTSTTGVITGFGSVFVNGVEYETTDAAVSTDDQSTSLESDLKVGMIVTLSGTVNDDGSTGNANKIHYEEQLKGPMDSIDLLAKTITVMGTVVLYDDLTNLDNLVLQNLKPGDILEISGYFNASKQLYATRIEKNDAATVVKKEGVVSQLNTTDKNFMLGSLKVDYSSADFTNFTSADLADGQKVRVKAGISSLVNNVLTINSIALQEVKQQSSKDDEDYVEGLITAVNGPGDIMLDGVHVITDDKTEFANGDVNSLALNTFIKVKGKSNDNGDLLAEKIYLQHQSKLKFEGAVQAIDLEKKTLKIMGVTFQITDQTEMQDESDVGERFFKLSSLGVNDAIQIQGFVDANGANIATSLKRENEQANSPHELKGTVSDITTNTFSLSGITVTINDQTVFEDASETTITQAAFFNQLTNGMLVETEGQSTADGFLISKAVLKIEKDENHDSQQGEPSEMRGLVQTIGDTSLTMAGLVVNFNSDTEFEANDQKLTQQEFLKQLTVGAQIKVKGTKNSDGSILAKAVELESNSSN